MFLQSLKKQKIFERKKLPNIKIFQAGTAKKDNRLIANGGRVLSITSKASTIKDARKLAYKAIKKIKWRDGFYRSDIGLK